MAYMNEFKSEFCQIWFCCQWFDNLAYYILGIVYEEITVIGVCIYDCFKCL